MDSKDQDAGVSGPSYGTINRVDQAKPEQEQTTTGDRPSKRCCGVVTIQVPVFFYFMSLNNTLPLVQYYLTDRMYEELGAPNTTADCSPTAEDSALMNHIQSRVSNYTMYLTFLSSFPAIIPVLFLGSLSNRFGRKVALYLVVLGTMGRMGMYALVIHYHWRIEYLYIGNFLDGITGSYGCFLMASYAIVADATMEGGQRRGFQIALTEAATLIGSSAGSSMAGYWVSPLGFLDPYLFSIGLMVFVLLYLIIFIPETVFTRETTPITCSLWLRSGHVFFKRGRRSFLPVALLAFFLCIFNLQANNSIILLYLLNYPFCWSTTHISVYGGVYMISSWVVVLTTTVFLGRRLADDSLALIGIMTGIVGFTLQGLSKSDLFSYLSAGSSLLSNITWPMLRTMMSKAVEAHEQGMLFAGIGTAEMLGTVSAGFLSPVIYKASLGFVHGLPFLCYAGLYVLVASLIIALVVRRKRQKKRMETDDDLSKLLATSR